MEEIRPNKELLKDYLNLPHSQSPQPKKPTYMPIENRQLATALDKAKDHLRELALRNQQKKEQAE